MISSHMMVVDSQIEGEMGNIGVIPLLADG